MMPKNECDGSMTTYLRNLILGFVYQFSLLIPVIVSVPDHHPVPSLQEPHTSSVASVDLSQGELRGRQDWL